MMLLAFVLLCLAVIVVGAALGTGQGQGRLGWVALAFALVALLIQLLGGLSVHIGH